MNKIMREVFGLITKGHKCVPLRGVDVMADIIGRGCKVKLIQTFINSEENPIEAVYKFPLPENCTVCGFIVKIGDRTIYSEVEDRDKAFELYDKALTNRDGAYLLDEERPNIFTLSVGNLPSGSVARIEIDYITILDTFGSEIRFFLPTTISPRYIPDGSHTNGIPEADIVNPPFALDVPYGLKALVNIHDRDNILSIESPSHKISIDISNNPVKISFASETVKMDRDFVLNIKHKKGFENRGYIYEADNGKFIQIDFTASFNDLSEHADKPSGEIIFVLDCSGSMGGSSINEAKKAIEIFIRALEEKIKFNVYRFGSTFEKLFDSAVSGNNENIAKALQYVTKIDADLGGTEILLPLKDIYETESGLVKNIILITDGQIGNESEVIKLIRNGSNKNRLFTVGIGYGPNEYFLKQAARISNATSELIAPDERIEPKILKLFKQVTRGNLMSFKIHWANSVEQAPAETVIFSGHTVSIFGKTDLTSVIPDKLKITAVFDSKPLEWLIDLKTINIVEGLPISLWARERIRELEEAPSSGSRQVDRKDRLVKEEIIELSKEFKIISRETSFIAVEKRKDSEEKEKEIIISKVPVMLTKAWGDANVHHCLLFSPLRYKFFHGTSTKRLYSKVNANFAMPIELLARTQETDIVVHLLTLQRPAGGFVIDKYIAKRGFSITIKELKDLSNTIITENATDKFVLLSTAIVLTILRKNFVHKKDIWEGVVEKSIKWLDGEIKKNKPRLKNISLMEWVEEFVEQSFLVE